MIIFYSGGNASPKEWPEYYFRERESDANIMLSYAYLAKPPLGNGLHRPRFKRHLKYKGSRKKLT